MTLAFVLEIIQKQLDIIGRIYTNVPHIFHRPDILYFVFGSDLRFVDIDSIFWYYFY